MNSLIFYLGIFYILIGSIFLSVPIIYLELGKPKDLIKAFLNLLIGFLLIIINKNKIIKNGDFDKAKDSYLNARKLAKQLASFYSDLNTSFKGVDARIPKEMQIKGKETLQILAESNKRLASLYIKDEKPDVAVPLLVETIRIMSPDSKEGREAYERLIQLGFVETKYKG